MFGQNQITGRSFFKGTDQLLVTSIFLSLQGEGPYQGQPALFVRLTYCNTNCIFCDTWFDSGDWFPIHGLVAKCIAMIKTKYNGDVSKCGIVVSGGEPALQENIAEFLLICEALKVKFTQIESNGILPIKRLPIRTTLVVSPKCSEQTKKYLKPNHDALQNAACLKFVVSADPESPYHVIPEWAFEWQALHKRPIYVSPMNMYKAAALEAAIKRINERKTHNLQHRSTTDEIIDGWDDTVLDREQNRLNHLYAFKYAVDCGLNLTLQMHLYGGAA